MKVSILTQVYGQPIMLKKFTDALREWPKTFASECELVVVDDCGSPPVEESEVGGLEPMGVQLLRHTKDVPWAQPCCRNLAAHHARGERLILLDPDMIIPPEKAQNFMLAATTLPRGHVTRFCLQEANWKKKLGQINTTSPNAWILHKKDFEAVHGYNECFAGHKGWSDVELMHVLDSAYKVRQDRALSVDFYRRSGELTDADVRSLEREVKTNMQTHAMHREEVRKKFNGNWHKWVMSRGPTKRNFPSVKLI
ncbi:MAG: glycosyltransferase family A protein [Dehalococcoidia bacterium]